MAGNTDILKTGAENDGHPEGQSKNEKSFWAKLCALFAMLPGFISDFLTPLFEFTFLFLVVCGMLLGMEILFRYGGKTNAFAGFLKRKDKEWSNSPKGLWFKPIFISTMATFVFLLLIFYLNNDTKNGFMAEHFEAVKGIQEIVLTSREAVEHAKEAAEQAKKTNEELVHIHEDVKGLKKETSENPRKELANMGITWSNEQYFEAIRNNDDVALPLFWAGRMDPYKASSGSDAPFIYLFIKSRNADWLPVIKTFIKHGVMDLQKNDMPAFGLIFSCLAPPYEVPLIGAGSKAWIDYMDKDSFTAGQIIFSEKLSFNKSRDKKLFNDLVAIGASREQLIELLETLVGGIGRRYKAYLAEKKESERDFRPGNYFDMRMKAEFEKTYDPSRYYSQGEYLASLARDLRGQKAPAPDVKTRVSANSDNAQAPAGKPVPAWRENATGPRIWKNQ